MSFVQTNYLVALESAYAGAAGATEIPGAQRAKIAVTGVQRTIPGKHGAKAVITTSQSVTLTIETTSQAHLLAHAAKDTSLQEVLNLKYMAWDGGEQDLRSLTIEPVTPAGVGDMQIPGSQDSGDAPTSGVSFQVVEDDQVASILEALSEAAAT